MMITNILHYRVRLSKSLLKGLIFFTLFLYYPGNEMLKAQYKTIIKGERPTIDLKNLPDEAYYEKTIRIKFDRILESKLDEETINKDKNGFILFNIPEIDSLNIYYGVIEAINPFDVKSLKNTFSGRHRHWGFHLWYELKTKSVVDEIEMVKQYSKTKQIQVAELKYRKILVGDNDVSLSYEQNRTENEHTTNDMIFPNDPKFEDQWHFYNTSQYGGTIGADIQLPMAWNIETGSQEVIVAVIDNGFNPNHPDLINNIWENIGYNFVDDSEIIVPGNHGTHVAGTIAAMNNNALGVSSVAGGWSDKPGVKIMSCQVFKSGPPPASGGFEIAPVWAADNGAAISQNSWSYAYPNHYEEIVLDAIDYFNIHGGGGVLEGGITVFAAGNNNSSGHYYPGFYSGTLAVAATNHHDIKAHYSNFGSYIDISAPGGETINSINEGVLSTGVDGYMYDYGTSMACPHVSGVVALMLSKAPGEFSNEKIINMLKHSTDDHYHINPNHEGQLGTGRLNAFGALTETVHHMTGVRNPREFSKTVIDNYRSILSWEQNINQDPVILASNLHADFGNLTGDMLIGDTIPGGGEIIYTGHSTYFFHDFGTTPNTTVYYKIWSYDESEDRISYGHQIKLKPERTTQYLPFDEHFNQPHIPAGWETQLIHPGQIGTGLEPQISFVQQSDNPSADPTVATHMVKFNSADAANYASMRLYTPPLSSKDLPYVAVKFDWFQDNQFPESYDKMYLQASTDLDDWITVGTFYRFNHGGGWKENIVYLPFYFYNQEKVYIGFLFEADQSIAAAGGNMYLDNITIKTDPETLVPGFGVSKYEAIQGEFIVVYNESAGEEIHSLQWDFGDDSSPSNATGVGPHKIFYKETGSKSISLLINDDIQLTKNDLIIVTENPWQKPINVSANVSEEGEHIIVTWDMSLNNDKNTNYYPNGYNIYRNGFFYENIHDGSITTFTDKNVPEGWMVYEVTAYYDHPVNESLPAGPAITAVNAVMLTIGIENGGFTDPEPGTYQLLANETIALTAFPDENYVFNHWLVDGEYEYYENPKTLVVQEDTDVLAKFESTVDLQKMVDIENRLIIYPNPTNAFLTIIYPNSHSHTTIQIINKEGSIVEEITDLPPGVLINEFINVGHLEKGVYMVRVISGEISETKKLIIIR